jgi:hypothetical protein
VIRTSRDGHVGRRRSQRSHSTFEGMHARVHLSFSRTTDATTRPGVQESEWGRLVGVRRGRDGKEGDRGNGR